MQVETTRNQEEEEEKRKTEDELAGHMALFSNLKRASGSAMYTFGDNLVQCSLFGPNPVAYSLNLLKKNYFFILLYPLGQTRNFIKDKSLFYYEYYFKRTFSPMVYDAMLPRCRTYIIVNEIEKGSAFLSTSLNAITLALIDSGYPLNYCLASCGIILDGRNNQLYTETEFKEKCTASVVHSYEPPVFTYETCDAIKATFYISNKSTNLKTVSLMAEGQFSLDNVLDAMQKANETNASFLDFTRKKVSERFV